MSNKLSGNDEFSHKDNDGYSQFNYLDFNGKIFLFSGTFKGKGSRRDMYEDKLGELNAVFKENNFSKDVDIFVCGPDCGNKRNRVDNYNEKNPGSYIHTIKQAHLDELMKKYELNPPPPPPPGI